MSEESKTPDFESIKQISPYGQEYWSARDLAPLLDYTNWQRFEGAINRAITACNQIGQLADDHFSRSAKMVELGSGAKREIKDYILSRFACYLIAQNGEPSKPAIAHAQAYFAISTHKNEIAELREAQEERLYLREQVSDGNKALSEAARSAGVLSQNFGLFQDAGYKGLYGGLGVEALKSKKKIGQREDILDRMGRAELGANLFRITQTEEKLRDENIIGQSNAMQIHHEVGRKVRKAIEDIGGKMPEELPAESSIKPLLEEKKRRRKKLPPKKEQQTLLFGGEEE